MAGEEARQALVKLVDRLAQRGLPVLGIREWPSGLVLSVATNLCVRWAEEQYRWHQGREERSHDAGDPDGAAEKIAALYHRLVGPAFREQEAEQP
ncbi:hypothetical protein [Actinomadura formosensis]|uniref:hypothetical protein n=1 Tax=Actinomadura formosensis TaxID=60706 RepID=UPI003D8C6D1C